MKHSATAKFVWVAIAGFLLNQASGAPARAEGINLSWDDCGNAGVDLKQFACDSNDPPPFQIIGSFDPPAGITNWRGITAKVNFTFIQSNDVPSWWALGQGGCRAGLLNVTFDFLKGPYTCADVFLGQGTGAFSFQPGSRVNSMTLRLLATIPEENATPVEPGTEYYAFKVVIQRAKTSGPGACEGCGESSCIVLEEIRMIQPEGEGTDPTIFTPRDRNFVAWQDRSFCPSCPCPVARMSLGELKCRFR